MKGTLLFSLFFALLATFQCIAQAGQEPGGRFAVKTDLADIGFQKSGLEVEWILRQQGKLALELQGGAMGAFWSKRYSPRLYGWFLRSGPKYYLQEPGKGIAIKAELYYAAWDDPAPEGLFVTGRRVRNAGFSAYCAYVFQPVRQLVVEPFLGLGYIATFAKFSTFDDSGGWPPVTTGDYRYDPYENFEWTRTGLSLIGDLRLNFGLKIGIRL